MYYEKLKLFFKQKKITNRQVADILGYSESMIGRYLNGAAKFDGDFVAALKIEFPEIDLEYIFSKNEEKLTVEVNEPTEEYNLDNDQVIKELMEMENRIGVIRKYLAQNCHKK